MKITGEMHFAKALEDLRSQGVEIADITPAELYALAEAARRCADPFSAVNAELAEQPVRVCRGVWLWPPTAGAMVWLEEFAGHWWKPGSMRFRWAQLYALRHAREPEAFAKLTGKWAAWRAIAADALKLAAHGAELAAAMRRAYGEDPRRTEPTNRYGAKRGGEELEGGRTDFAALVARLEAVSGIPRREWLWGRSMVYTLRAYGEMHAFAAAFAADRRERKQMNDELDEAMNGLARAKSGIIRRIGSAAEQPHGNADKDDGGEGGGEIDEEIQPAPLGRGAVGKDHGAGHAGDEAVVDTAVDVEHMAHIVPQGGDGGK